MSDSENSKDSQDSRSEEDANTSKTKSPQSSQDVGSSKSANTQPVSDSSTKKANPNVTPLAKGKFLVKKRNPKEPNPLKNWQPMSGPVGDELTAPPDPVEGLQLSLLAGKTSAEQSAIISEYKRKVEVDLIEYTAALAKFKRYEIRVRLDEYRKGIRARCSTLEIKNAVEKIIEAQKLRIAEPWGINHDNFDEEDADAEQEKERA